MNTAEKALEIFRLEEKRRFAGPSLTLFWLLLGLVAALFVSAGLGRYPVAPGDLLTLVGASIFGYEHHLPAVLETVFFNVRLPRILASILVGSALAVAGAAYQGLFRNPLVSPDILGTTGGAGFGAALAIYFSMGPLGVQLSAFSFGLIAVLITYAISIRLPSEPTLSLILSGVMMSAMFSALICMVKFIADPFEKLPSITFWMMGSLSGITTQDLAITSGPILLGMAVLLLFRWRLNVLTFGDDEANSMGLNVARLRTIVIISATVVTSAAVSISGMIGWVGLVIPHLARMVVGPNYKVLLPTSILMGAIYLLLVDDIARLIGVIEVPIGVLTALLGVPFFLYLFSQRKVGS